jgi:hypothetical protein
VHQEGACGNLIGGDYALGASCEYRVPAQNEFIGAVNWVHIDLEKGDRMITPEERFRIAMAVQ